MSPEVVGPVEAAVSHEAPGHLDGEDEPVSPTAEAAAISGRCAAAPGGVQW
ncbi:hypothetical protein ACFH04_00380 [Streptomyces noboritoensis]|uniref:Uncharacterized protein n=1 Tax=Streptomyces noboritoensis TaxID=67337 RepID=A0ABV6T8V7_9ACTN